MNIRGRPIGIVVAGRGRGSAFPAAPPAGTSDDIPAFGTDGVKAYRFSPIKGKALRFYVKAQHGCHLAFTTDARETPNMFEVIIGGWRGAYSAIVVGRVNTVVKSSTPGFLNNAEFREFWITFDGGHIRVGRGGQWNAFMECVLPRPFNITHFGYTTADSSQGWWKFISSKVIKTPDSLKYHYEPMYGDSIAFSVASPYNCRLALTSGPTETFPMIEIFIGSWRNKFSCIRLNKDENQTVVKASTPGIVTNAEQRTFWIELNNGVVGVGHGGQNEPFMKYSLSSAWKATHYGFCNGNGATGEWNFYI